MKFRTQLKEVMRSLGVIDLFDHASNLSGISDEDLYVSDAVHEAFVEVNEEGTEAAGATSAVIGLRVKLRAKVFRANRPFYFMIYDSSENIPLFVGKLTNPSVELH